MRERRIDALTVGLVGLVARLGVVLWARGRFPAVEDGHYYDVLARRLAEGHGYTWLWPDGTVTYVAHYPVGYPALVAVTYLLFGATASAAMTLNAVLGAASAYGVHRLVDRLGTARWRPAAAGLAVALHPALVPYTAAVMTEGVTAALLVIAASLGAAARTRARPFTWLVGTGIVMGLAILVRPQCVALAPVIGAFAVPLESLRGMRTKGRRSTSAALVGAIALGCVLPWTVRNCERMHRCALVSVNGGWNLLIGATTQTGAWQPVSVPAECATVWDEAAKDVCFARAAWRDIGVAPGAWILRTPAKLAMTFDYLGAAPWYLHASNGFAFDERAKTVLGAVETVVCRLLLVAALLACAWLEGRRPLARRAIGVAGAVAAFTLHGWIGYLGISLIVTLMGWRAIVRAPAVVPMSAGVIAVTAVVHAAFFGAGRYGLMVTPFVAALAFLGDRDKTAAEDSDPRATA